MIPDIPVLAVGIYESIKYLCKHPSAFEWYWIQKSALKVLYENEWPDIVNYLYATVGYYRYALLLRQCLHSIFFWIILATICWQIARLRRQVLIIACGALFFHILIDMPTHTLTAHNYFWPFTLYPVRGFVSHDNPWLLRIEIAIWTVWLLGNIKWIWRKLSSPDSS